jgi:AcrR family transcriptional regulator
MKEPSPSSDLPLGLRERKKLKTRAAIQEQALRLFREQGYSQTTVEQIAAAAEVSPSTFFRYFPTKEDVVLFDATDTQMLDAFGAQPKDISIVEALRRSMHAVYDRFSEEEAGRETERQELMLGVPELRMRTISMFAEAIKFLAGVIAERVGKPADDPDVHVFAGALMGAILGQYLSFDGVDPRDLLMHVDKAFDLLERGLKL